MIEIKMVFYNDYEDENKIKHNHLIAAKAKPFVTGALILDSFHLGTTQILTKECGLLPPQIHVPEMNPSIYEEIARQQLCQTYNMTMRECLSKLDAEAWKTINVAYFDYMGTVEGNESRRIYPLGDMDYFLGKSPQKMLVFACTFCLRNPFGLFKEYKGRSLEQISQEFLKPLFQYTQWRVKYKHECSYSREQRGRRTSVMGFFIYVLVKDTTLDPDDVSFIIKKGCYSGYYPERVKKCDKIN